MGCSGRLERRTLLFCVDARQLLLGVSGGLSGRVGVGDGPGSLEEANMIFLPPNGVCWFVRTFGVWEGLVGSVGSGGQEEEG